MGMGIVLALPDGDVHVTNLKRKRIYARKLFFFFFNVQFFL
jgi:hypothetical protein